MNTIQASDSNNAAAIKAIATWKMANTLAKALGRRYSSRWQFVDFLGPAKRESAGIVDILAIRKSSSKNDLYDAQAYDFFDIVLIQCKGGGAREPTAAEISRMRKVAQHYHIEKIVLFQWKKGHPDVTGYRLLLEDDTWGKVTKGEDLFGRPKVRKNTVAE